MTAVSALITLSGLTPTQIGRLFGTSARTVQNWADGAPMSACDTVRLEHLIEKIQPLGETPVMRRAALLDTANGKSAFQHLVEQTDQGTVVRGRAGSVVERLGL